MPNTVDRQTHELLRQLIDLQKETNRILREMHNELWNVVEIALGHPGGKKETDEASKP